MRCREAQRLLSRRMDGPLPSASALVLEAHLHDCAECRLAVERYERAWQVLAELGRPGPAPDDWARIEAAAARDRPWVSRWFRLEGVPAPAAAAWVLVVMMMLGGTGGLLLSKAFTTRRADPAEIGALADTLGDLPWGSPASGLTGLLARQQSQEVP